MGGKPALEATAVSMNEMAMAGMTPLAMATGKTIETFAAGMERG
tara:strand:+ start:827 stop:958 length:132 start_codon:yes stop_codon:yes gene_type:complete